MAATNFSHYRIRGIIALACVALIAVVAGSLWFHVFRRHPKPIPPPMRTVLLTNYPGHQRNPSFSPEGNRIAFVWDGEKQDNWDIYVKQIGTDRPLRLTADPAQDDLPDWSPDGRYIAFWRVSNNFGGAIYVVPAVGGAERKLVDIAGGTSFAWAPNSKYLAYSALEPNKPETIFLVAVDYPHDRRPLSSSSDQAVGVFPSFSPDGKTVGLIRGAPEGGDGIYLVPVGGTGLKLLTSFKGQISNLSWTSDGAYFIFCSDYQASRLRLWKVAASGGQPEPLSLGQDVGCDVSASRDGHRLAYTKGEWNANIWRYEVPPPGGRSRPPTRMIASMSMNTEPQFSPDGKRVALVSWRSGNGEIWVCDSNGSNPRQLTSSHVPVGAYPHWSPDGREIAFAASPERHVAIYVVSAEGGKPRRLTSDDPSVAAPTWSRDGKWIYFGSKRSGAYQVWRMPSAGGDAVQVTKKGGFAGLESRDGKTLYYAKRLQFPGWRKYRGLWKVPVEGGQETLVLKEFAPGLYDCWGLTGAGIYFFNEHTETIDFFSFATRRITQIAKPEKRGGPLAVSPDGRCILFSQVDVDTSHIMMVENFRW
jgi:Tol biopolymer transport system component